MSDLPFDPTSFTEVAEQLVIRSKQLERAKSESKEFKRLWVEAKQWGMKTAEERDEAYRAVLYMDDILVLYMDDILAGESGDWSEEKYEEVWALIDLVVSAASRAQQP